MESSTRKLKLNVKHTNATSKPPKLTLKRTNSYSNCLVPKNFNSKPFDFVTENNSKNLLNISQPLSSQYASTTVSPSSRDGSVNSKASSDENTTKKPLNFSFNKSATISHSREATCLPVTADQALSIYSEFLNNYERQSLKQIENVYYMRRRPKKNCTVTDERGYFLGVKGDHLMFRYEIKEALGRGSFGVALKCLDHKRKELVAIKVIKNTKKETQLGEEEIETLHKVGLSENDDKNIVQMKGYFDYCGHLCIVFELLYINLFTFLSHNYPNGMNLNLIKRFATQILVGLKHVHSLGYIHCDLKPENILLKSKNKSSVKVIDFGSATHVSERMYSYIQSRYYRAPEILLDRSYDYKIDMWSLGCVLAELFLGIPIFPGENERDQVIRITSVIGTPPGGLMQGSRRWRLYFNADGSPKFLRSRRGVVMAPGSSPLEVVCSQASEDFIDFLKMCLKWESSERMSAEEALKHPWIKGNPTNSTTQTFNRRTHLKVYKACTGTQIK